MRARLACLSLGLALSGCAALFQAAFRAPTLRFERANVRGASLDGLTLETVWTLDNPNPVGISLAEVSYAFFVEDKPIAAGRPAEGLAIPAAGSAPLVFPASVRFADLAGAAEALADKDVARYRAEGVLGISTPLGVVRIPLAHEGTFEVPKVPAVELQRPQLIELGLVGATIEFSLRLTNRNSYPLPLGTLRATLLVGGAMVGSVSTDAGGLLEGRAARTLSLPVQVRFASALQAAEAIRQGRGAVELQGELASGSARVPIRASGIFEILR